MTDIPSQTITLTLPSGYKAEITIPTNHEGELVLVGLRAFLGTLVGISKAQDKVIRRTFLAKYLASLINISEMTLKRMVVAKTLETTSMAHIVEDFLESLKQESKGDTSE